MRKVFSIFLSLLLILTAVPQNINAEETELPFLVDYGASQSKVEDDGRKIIFETTGYDFWNTKDTSSIYVLKKQEFPYGELCTAEFSATLQEIDAMTDKVITRGSMGIMIRKSLNEDSAFAMFRVDAIGGAMAIYRPSDGENSKYSRLTIGEYPVKMKIVRKGNNVILETFNGGEWSSVFTTSVDLGKEHYCAIGGFSHTQGEWIGAEFTDIEYSYESKYNPEDYAQYEETRTLTSDLLAWENFADGSLIEGEEAPLNPIWKGAPQYIITEPDDKGNKAWRRQGVTGFLYIGENEWTDYEISVDLKFMSEINNAITYIVFRNHAMEAITGSRYYLGFTENNKLILYGQVNEGAMWAMQSLAEYTLPYKYQDGIQRTLKVRAVDDVFTVYVDDEFMFEAKDTIYPLLNGSVGLYTENADVQISEFIVRKIDDGYGEIQNRSYNQLPDGVEYHSDLVSYVIDKYENVPFENTYSGRFKDVGKEHWAFDYINSLAKKKIINGKENYQYFPEAAITREEFVKIIVTALGINPSEEKSGFTDVPEDAWFNGYVKAAYDAGLISGISDSEFGVGQNVTREDAAVIINRAFELQQNDKKAQFTDSDMISDYAMDAVNALVYSGIITGFADGSFKPKNTATRAEVAKLVMTVLNFEGGK